MSRERMVTVGGGTGCPVVNEALFRTGRVDLVDSVAAVFDSGGATGRRRIDSLGQEIAYSDAMRIILSLVAPSDQDSDAFRTIKKMFTHRDERNTVLGQDIFNRFSNREQGFSEIEDLMSGLNIPLSGRVLPSSTEPANISFSTLSGRRYLGEHQLDRMSMSKDTIASMDLKPEVDAYPPAVEAIKEADHIILASGSLHGSVLANFLPRGMTDAVSDSSAEVYLVTNLVSTRNETHGFSPGSFLHAVEEYTGKRPHGLIVPEMTQGDFERLHPRSARIYDLEHAHFLGWEAADLRDYEKEGVKIIRHDATNVVSASDGSEVVRHDPERLAHAMVEIFSRAR